MMGNRVGLPAGLVNMMTTVNDHVVVVIVVMSQGKQRPGHMAMMMTATLMQLLCHHCHCCHTTGQARVRVRCRPSKTEGTEGQAHSHNDNWDDNATVTLLSLLSSHCAGQGERVR